ncbi:MAG: HD domain-containing protein [Candidatus Peregrinibacteria bacterium]|nr:HD domain-containing protein [Candidatus Peregrinibacteria bacterium]
MKKSDIKIIYEKFKVPQNIIFHMQKVAKICEKLAEEFAKKKIKIRKNLIIKSALVHDVFKTSGKDHAKKMADYLRKIGEKEMANLVEKHDFWQIDNLKTWDEKILYYADKRTYENQEVSLKRRIEESRKRYPHPSKEVLETERKMFKLEKEFKTTH